MPEVSEEYISLLSRLISAQGAFIATCEISSEEKECSIEIDELTAIRLAKKIAVHRTQLELGSMLLNLEREIEKEREVRDVD